MANSSLYQFDGDPEDEAAWQAFVAANSESAADEHLQIPSTSTALKGLYELFLLFVIGVAFAGTILWQKDITQIAALEDEVQTLEEKLVNAEGQQQATVSMPLSAATWPRVRHVIQTDYLRFVVETEQMAMISDMASKLDTAYGELSADLGLQTNPLGEKVNVLLVNDSADYADGPYAELDVIVIKVAGSTEPIASDPQFVAQELYSNLYGQLARRLLDTALMTRQIRPKWDAVLTHLYSTLAQGHLSSSVATLSAYKVQQRELTQMLSLSFTILRREPGDWMYPDYTLAHSVADSLVEYILVSYGRDAIPPLLDALSLYDSWDEVIPAAFDMPRDQFETEWHAYLYEHYPSDSAYSQ
jgi:hypothetical protein